MGELVSKGMLALRRSKSRAEKITVGGETFYFRKLTIDQEDHIEEIVKRHQDPSVKVPPQPEQGADQEAVAAYTEAFIAYKRNAERNFRRLTADLMKFCLLDETDKPMFEPEDDVYTELDNVYAEKFFTAYGKFRQGAQAAAAEAEQRFPK